MKKEVSIRDVAAKAGVAPATVSRMLSGKAKVSIPLQRKILLAVETLNYQVESNQNILVILPSAYFFGYQGMICEQLQAVLTTRNYHPVFVFQNALPDLAEFYFAGAISILFQDEEVMCLRKKLSLPWVAINSTAQLSEDIPRVGSDEEHICMLGLEYLHRLGHRKIAFFTFSSRPIDNDSTRRRIQTAEKYAEQYMNSGFFIKHQHFYSLDTLHRQVRKFYEKGFTAFFGAAESFSLQLIQALQNMGVSVPEQASVIVYEIKGVSNASLLPETAVVQDFQRMASEAVNLLERRMKGIPVTNVSIPGFLHIRESTGAYMKKDNTFSI